MMDVLNLLLDGPGEQDVFPETSSNQEKPDSEVMECTAQHILS